MVIFVLTIFAADRVPFIERFTNIGCGYCPPCGTMIDSLTGVHGDAISVVEVHVDWTISSDPYYVAAAADCEERWTHYSITGVLAVAFDGKKLANWSTTPGEITSRLSVAAPIDIGVVSTDTSVIVTVDVETAVTGSNNRLFVSVVQDSNYLPSAPNGEVWANNVLRILYPSSTGEVIDLSAVGSQVFEYVTGWDASWDPLRTSIVAWVQDMSAPTTGYTVINSAHGSLPMPEYFFAYTPDETQTVVWSDTVVVLEGGVLTNLGTYSDTYIIKLIKSIPAGWSASYCAGSSCFPDSGSVDLEPDSSINIEIDFFTSGAGIGTIYLIISSLETGANDTIMYKTVQSPTVLLVDDDEGSAYESYYTSSLDALGEIAMTFDRSASTLAAADLTSFEIVIWFTSADWSDLVSSGDMTAISAYLDGGGKLFMSSQDLGYYCDDLGYDTWYGSYFRATYLTDDSGLRNLGGSIGTPFEGLSLSLFTGDAADFTPYTSTITPIGGAVGVFQYGLSTDVAGLLFDGTYRLVYFAFPFEAINGATVRDTVMSRTLDFLRNGMGIEESIKLPTKPLIVNASPNPFNSAVSVEFEIASDSDVRLTIYDLAGRMVATVIDGPLVSGEQRAIWDGRSDSGDELSSGIYLMRLEAGDKKTTRKVLLAK